jgi:hypothetical protein
MRWPLMNYESREMANDASQVRGSFAMLRVKSLLFAVTMLIGR